MPSSPELAAVLARQGDPAREYFARSLATWLHRGQVDKNGEPYHFHLARVSSAVLHSHGFDYSAAAWLHDILEDTSLDAQSLGRLLGEPGIPVFAAVLQLTRRNGQSWRRYIDECRRDPIARVVKIADINDNLLPRRLELWRARDPEAADRHESMGRKALQWLEAPS